MSTCRHNRSFNIRQALAVVCAQIRIKKNKILALLIIYFFTIQRIYHHVLWLQTCYFTPLWHTSCEVARNAAFVPSSSLLRSRRHGYAVLF